MNALERFLEKRRRATRPLVVWGGARLAEKIGHFLDFAGVPFDGYAVNERYSKGGMLNGHPVFCLESYIATTPCDIAVGFGGYHEGMLRGLRADHMGEVYALDFAGMLVLDECNAWDDEFSERHRGPLREIRESLADDMSRKALDWFVHQKMTGCYAKPFDRGRQYFDESIIQLGANEVFVDCGACHGEDTIEFFSRLDTRGHESIGRAYAIEPDGENASILRKRLFALGQQVQIVEAAVGKSRGTLRFAGGRRDQSRLALDGETEIALETIDNIVGNSPATFIKMDVEGAELDALIGGGGNPKAASSLGCERVSSSRRPVRHFRFHPRTRRGLYTPFPEPHAERRGFRSVCRMRRI